MSVALWSPYDRRPVPIRRNPNASVYEPIPGVDEAEDGRSFLIMPDSRFVLGDATSVASDALASLNRAGPRGGAVLGMAVGLLFGGSHRLLGALAGGLLGYYSGHYVANIAEKTLWAAKAIDTVQTTVEKATGTAL